MNLQQREDSHVFNHYQRLFRPQWTSLQQGSQKANPQEEPSVKATEVAVGAPVTGLNLFNLGFFESAACNKEGDAMPPTLRFDGRDADW